VRLPGDLGSVDATPGPRLDAELIERVAAVPGVVRAVGDVSFPATADGRRVDGHDWAAAQLTPYVLRDGSAVSNPAEVVADARLGVRVGSKLRISSPGGEETLRVSGVAAAAEALGRPGVFFTPATARRLAGTPRAVNSIGVMVGADPEAVRERLRDRLGLEVLDPAHAADADPGDARVTERQSLIAIFGAMGGIAGAVALFVVAGTFSLAIAQRRRETAVLRALGATPRQVRRLIAAEALIVSIVAGALGLATGGPLATAILEALQHRGVVPPDFAAGTSWIPLAAAIGMGVGIAQLAVVAAAYRAGRTRPAEALREAAVEHPRPGVLRVLAGLMTLGGGVAMALVFSGFWAKAFAVLTGTLLAMGVGLLGRWVLGAPAALLARPLRPLGAAGLLASTTLAANRWRTAALATPIVLVAMLAGIQGVVQSSDERHTERVTAQRVIAGHVVTGGDGAPVPPATTAELAALPGVQGVAATLATEVHALHLGLADQGPWTAAGLRTEGARTLDLDVVSGDLARVRGDGIAVSRAFADGGDLAVGDALDARMADTAHRRLRVVAVYARAAGLGDVVLEHAVALRHAAVRGDAAVFVTGADRSLARYADAHPGLRVMSRPQYLATVRAADQRQGWAVWLIVGLATAFAALALVNTAAMATAERREELATIRLLGGTGGHVTRIVALETAPVIVVALIAGGAIVALAVAGVPRGITGIPIAVPAAVIAALLMGAAGLGALASVVTARLALRASPAAAMRVRE
jgi:putative ABC transport system permease protein